MTLLAVDTSGQTASVAIVNDYISIGEITCNAPAKHSEILLPMLDELFSFSGYTLDNIDYIACVNGPGSFTGLRIGAATAMGLARGAGIGLIAVPALDALAYNIMSEGYIMPMMDARREQVYTALYKKEKNNAPLLAGNYHAVSLPEALSMLDGQPVVFLGDGAWTYREIIQAQYPMGDFAPINNNRQRAASAGLCAMDMLADGYAPVSVMELMYIRKPQAQREREQV
jgi:tRNA threonylcarbamoyladenosine biosynthesis protein TsaB